MNGHQRPEVGSAARALLFILGCLVFSWPLMSIGAAAGSLAMLLYLFLGWAGLLLVLAWLARSGKHGQEDSREL